MIRAQDVHVGDLISELGRRHRVLEVVDDGGPRVVLVTDRGSISRPRRAMLRKLEEDGSPADTVPPWVLLLSVDARTRLVQLEQGPIATSPLDPLLRESGLADVDEDAKTSQLTPLGWASASALRRLGDDVVRGLDDLAQAG